MSEVIKYQDIKDLISEQHAAIRVILKELSDTIERNEECRPLLSKLMNEFNCLQQAEQRTLIQACYRLNRLVPIMDELAEDSAIIQILIQNLQQNAENETIIRKKAKVLVQLIEKLLLQKEFEFLNFIRTSFSPRHIFEMGTVFRKELLKKSSFYYG